ncbi:MAG: nitroreductase [Eubacterium sp.]|nr:nitroreductase [Candidatus Colimonas fimequi]
MDVLELMRERHSIRKYTDQPIEQEKREVLDALCAEINEESGLSIQMMYDEPDCFNNFLTHYGWFQNVNNYISVAGKKGKDLDEKCGYYGEKLVLKAQELGLNTCWAAMTKGRSRSEVANGEKVAIVIAIGYGDEPGEPHKNKERKKLVKEPAMAPEWFERGVEAAMLAPTAMNQQKFKISLDGDDAKITAGLGFMAKLDLGIIKYHFEVASGHKVK